MYNEYIFSGPVCDWKNKRINKYKLIQCGFLYSMSYEFLSMVKVDLMLQWGCCFSSDVQALKISYSISSISKKPEIHGNGGLRLKEPCLKFLIIMPLFYFWKSNQKQL